MKKCAKKVKKIKKVKKKVSKKSPPKKAKIAKIGKGRLKKKAVKAVKKKGKPAKTLKKRKLPASLKKVNFQRLQIKQAAAIICQVLTDMGFDPILTGKACADIYGGSDVHSGSIDFVISEYVVEDIENAMSYMGFKCKVHRTFSNKDSKYEVSFLPPPLMVGDDVVGDPAILKTTKGVLKLLNETDCTRHRLASFYRFGEEDALNEAVAVAKNQKVDIPLIEKWSHWEWASDKFEIFKEKLA